jgi:hypothetical protein
VRFAAVDERDHSRLLWRTDSVISEFDDRVVEASQAERATDRLTSA